MNTPLDFSLAEWVKSTYSNGDGGDCVEWAPEIATAGIVPVRDSKVPAGPVLFVNADGWAAFVHALNDEGFPIA